MNSLINSLASEMFTPEGKTINPMANMQNSLGAVQAYSRTTKPWIGLTEEEIIELANTNMPTIALIHTVCSLLKAQNT